MALLPRPWDLRNAGYSKSRFLIKTQTLDAHGSAQKNSPYQMFPFSQQNLHTHFFFGALRAVYSGNLAASYYQHRPAMKSRQPQCNGSIPQFSIEHRDDDKAVAVLFVSCKGTYRLDISEGLGGFCGSIAFSGSSVYSCVPKNDARNCPPGLHI